MKTNMEMPLLELLRPRRASAGPAPSLRIAATRKNRSLLRWMRAAELSAWQNADARHLDTLRAAAAGMFPKPLFTMSSR